MLIAHFLSSAASLLAPGGRIHLTLCGNQRYSWHVDHAVANLGGAEARRIERSDPWRCFVCDPFQIKPIQERCTALLEKRERGRERAKRSEAAAAAAPAGGPEGANGARGAARHRGAPPGALRKRRNGGWFGDGFSRAPEVRMT